MSSETGRLLRVEFVGTPGAGKTTAAAAMTAALRERGVDAGSMIDAARPHAARTGLGRVAKAAPGRHLRGVALWQVYRWEGWRRARAIRREPLGMHVLGSEAARPLPPDAKRHTLDWFFRLAGRLRFLEVAPAPGEVLVVDDGFLHRSVALHASPDEPVDPAAVSAYVDLLPAPDLTIHVRADVATCAARVRARGPWGHRAGWTDADLDRYLPNAEAVVRVAVERARARGWTVVDVDNDGDPDTLSKSIGDAADLLHPAAVTGGGA